MQYLFGLPYATPSGWFVETLNQGPEDTSAQAEDLEGASTPHAFPFTLSLERIRFVVDVYKTHYKCCWSRTMLETKLEECSRATSSALQAANSPGPSTLLEVAEYADGIYALQQKSLPRQSKANRIVYSDGAPPVLRCSLQDTGDLVYYIEGAVALECPYTRHLPVFPLFLAMEPVGACACHVHSDPPQSKPIYRKKSRQCGHNSTNGADDEAAQPQLLLLQDVAMRAGATCVSTGKKAARAWVATYTPFTWIVSPLGNQYISNRVVTRSANLGRGKSPISVSIDSAPVEKPLLTPLAFDFRLYASQSPTMECRHAIVEALASLRDYCANVSAGERYGIGGDTVPGAELLGRVDGRRERLTLAARPELLMTALDTVYEPTDTSRASTATRKRQRARDGDSAVDKKWSADANVRASLIPVGTVRTQRAIPREWCSSPNAIHMAAVIALDGTKWPLCLSWGVEGCRHSTTPSPLALSVDAMDDLHTLSERLRAAASRILA